MADWVATAAGSARSQRSSGHPRPPTGGPPSTSRRRSAPTIRTSSSPSVVQPRRTWSPTRPTGKLHRPSNPPGAPCRRHHPEPGAGSERTLTQSAVSSTSGRVPGALYAPRMGPTSSAPLVERFGDGALLIRAADQATVHAIASVLLGDVLSGGFVDVVPGDGPCWSPRRNRSRRARSAALDQPRDRGVPAGGASATPPRGRHRVIPVAMADSTAPTSRRRRTWPVSPPAS